jgi:PIN domain nuclease of toxin-antitoxin system
VGNCGEVSGQPPSPDEEHYSSFFACRNTYVHKSIDVLPITGEHALRAALLPGPHRDPFDRMLIAKALGEKLTLISNDKALDG